MLTELFGFSASGFELVRLSGLGAWTCRLVAIDTLQARDGENQHTVAVASSCIATSIQGLGPALLLGR